MSTARPRARIKARSEAEFRRWERLAEQQKKKTTTYVTPTEVKK
jgi:hypothetical protein